MQLLFLYIVFTLYELTSYSTGLFHAIDWSTVVFNMLTVKGIYGREMYETWYKMTVMVQSGLDITPAITHRFPFREFESAFAAARSGDAGKVIMDWIPRADG